MNVIRASSVAWEKREEFRSLDSVDTSRAYHISKRPAKRYFPFMKPGEGARKKGEREREKGYRIIASCSTIFILHSRESQLT